MRPLPEGSYIIRPFKVYKNHSYSYVWQGSNNRPFLSIDELLPPSPDWTWNEFPDLINSGSGVHKYNLYKQVENFFYPHLELTESKVFPIFDRGWEFSSSISGCYAVGISQASFGEQIYPGTFQLTTSHGSASILDDSNGRLYCSSDPTKIIGNIFYPFGIGIIKKIDTNFNYGSIYNNNLLITQSAVFNLSSSEWAVANLIGSPSPVINAYPTQLGNLTLLYDSTSIGDTSVQQVNVSPWTTNGPKLFGGIFKCAGNFVSGSTSLLRLYQNPTFALKGFLEITWNTASLELSSVRAINGTVVTTQSLGNNAWFIAATTEAVTAGNSGSVYIHPADSASSAVSMQGSIYAGGIFVTDFSSSIELDNSILNSSLMGSVLTHVGMYLTNTTNNVTIKYQSQQTLYENTIICTLERGTFNFSTNASLGQYDSYTSSSISGSQRLIDQMFTGSLTPYITTLGFYNDNWDLIAIAKFPRAIRRVQEIDQTFIVKFDI